jgi:hypothetical protein
MSMLNYWPVPAEVDRCIRTEAETIDEAVLLAVHEPVRILKRSAGAGAVEEKTEEDLLDALLADSGDGSAVIVSLTGPSGVGKSHMVRWLGAQLARHARHDDLLVILVPKTAGLRHVVELILEPLRGSDYDALRAKLSTAIESISMEEAPIRLATELALQLKRRFSEWIAALRGGDRSFAEKVYHAQQLQTLLSDPVFRDGMLASALGRIVSRAVAGAGETAAAPQFEVDDLVWPDGANYTHATRDAQLYYRRLCDHDGAARVLAVDVLGGVIDEALRMVFRFEQALGGHTIEELVGAIRTQLLREGKELVLLIEDFAALSGIQGPLLSLIVAQSDQGGQRVRAPIRTALAVTDGFLPQRDTILTRAKGEWVIASEYGSDQALMDRLISMAGRYLNAARWGHEAIRRQFDARGDRSLAGLYDWVRPYADEGLDANDEESLRAFGKTRAGHFLFPFNERALHSLCKQELRADGKTKFNPRTFINQVLRATLAERPWFEQKQFPKPGFKGGSLLSGAETELDNLRYNPAVRARLTPVLIHWCGNPATLSGEAPVPKAVFEAFALPYPFSGNDVPGSDNRRAAASAGPTRAAVSAGAGTAAADTAGASTADAGTAMAPAARPARMPSIFETEVERWGARNRPSQVTARTVRNLLAAAVGRRLDLNGAAIKKVATLIWLPFVDHNNPVVAPWFRLAEPTSDVPGWLRKALIGLEQWDKEKKWDYPNAEDDYAFVQRLLDEFAPQVAGYFSNQSRTRLSAALHAGYRHNLLLGINAVKALPAAFEKMFVPLDDGFDDAHFVASDSSDRAPALGKVLARARLVRSELQQVLLQDAACFQGQGTTPLAIDFAHLMSARKAAQDEAPLRIVLSKDANDHLSDLLGGGFERMVDVYSAVVARRGQYLFGTLGTDFDKQAWLDTIRQAISAAQLLGQLPSGVRHAECNALLDALGKTAITELLVNVRTALAAAPGTERDEQLRFLGRVDVAFLVRTAGQVRSIADVLAGIERNLRGAEADCGIAPEDVRARFQDELQAAVELLVGEGG